MITSLAETEAEAETAKASRPYIHVLTSNTSTDGDRHDDYESSLNNNTLYNHNTSSPHPTTTITTTSSSSKSSAPSAGFHLARRSGIAHQPRRHDHDHNHNHDHLRSFLISGSLWSDPYSAGAEDSTNTHLLSITIPDSVATIPNTRSRRTSLLHNYRALSSSHSDNMAAVSSDDSVAIDTAPNSPPELSYSKSSKSSSSSFRSSSLDDDDRDAPSEKLSQFEDITLEEDAERDSVEGVVRDSNLKPESRPTLRRPLPRTAMTIDVPKRGVAQSSTVHDSTNGPSPQNPYPYTNYRSHAANGVLQDQSLNLPTGRMMSRGFSSPSASSYLMHSSHRITSRSPSPSKPFVPFGSSGSPQSLASTTPKASYETPRLSPGSPFARRASWQAFSRKPAHQLEPDFNDDDEDVPEGAILENVPISPMPGQPLSASTTTSRTPSPRRQPSYTNLHSANVPKNARRPSAPPLRPPRSPRGARPPPLPHSATISAFPPSDTSDRKRQRAKSWNDELNEEARHLSAALEEYAERMSSDRRDSSRPNSASNSPPRQKSSDKKTPRSSVVELPPVQKGNIMIDPLPISKEKEAVLTRTRPSWLPPKSQKEEKKHLREWQNMMARAADAEKKRDFKGKEAVIRKNHSRDNVERIWEQDVLPNWDTAVCQSKTRELWWRGIAPSCRGIVWQKAIANDLGLSTSSFQAALNRARTLEEKMANLPAEDFSKSTEAAWFSAIDRDVPAVFPELGAFAPDAPGNTALSDVLKAYAVYRSDLGYVYGTHLIAGLLCLNLPPADAFVALANLLNRPLPMAFLVHDQAAMFRGHALVLDTLRTKFARLYAHLTNPTLGLKAEEFLDPLFRCLFAYNLPSDHVCRLWDVFVFEGDHILIHAAVAILGLLEPKLYGTKKEILDVISWNNPRRWDFASEDAFVAAVRGVGPA